MVGQQGRMRDSPDMPQLEEDSPVFLVHRIYNFSPGMDLLRRINPWRIHVPLAHRGNLSRLCNDEACRRALRVVGHREFAMDAIWISAVPRRRRHQDTVRQCQRAELKWFKKEFHFVIPLLSDAVGR